MIHEAYKILLERYGKQGWWPVTEQGQSTPTYRGGPKNKRQQIEVMAGTILTQNTSWNNAARAIENLRIKGWLSVKHLASIPEHRLAQVIRPSGYFNQKAIKLKTLAHFLRRHTIASLQKKGASELRQMLLSVRGIGPETADSIILYALKKPIFVVDAYTRRIFERMGQVDCDYGYDDIQQLFEESLPRSQKVYNEYHALIVEHGKKVCRKNPACDTCVLSPNCKKLL